VLFFPPISHESIAGTCWGRQKKQAERLFFCIGIIELSCFAYDVISILHFFLLIIKKGEIAGNFSFSWHIRYCMCFHLISQFIMH